MATKKILTNLELDGTIQASTFYLGNSDNYIRESSGDVELYGDASVVIESGDGVIIEISDVLYIDGSVESTGSTQSTSFIKTGGTSAQFLKADGSVDTTTYTGDQDLSGYLLNTTDTLTGRLTITSSARVGNDTATASSANEGALRYYTDIDGSYVDMCMQYQNSGTPANDYKWTNVVRHLFPS